MENKKFDILLFIFYVCILIGAAIFTFYQFTEKVNECTRDPIKYGVEVVRYKYDADYVYGSMTFVKDNNPQTWYFGDEVNLIIRPQEDSNLSPSD